MAVETRLAAAGAMPISVTTYGGVSLHFRLVANPQEDKERRVMTHTGAEPNHYG
jgi:hypothetical protein